MFTRHGAFSSLSSTLWGTEALKHSRGVTIPKARFAARFPQRLLGTSLCISLVFVFFNLRPIKDLE